MHGQYGHTTKHATTPTMTQALHPDVNLKKSRIMIAGAGIGGLTAALALLQQGFDVDVFEQAPEVREIGAALWISPNGASVLFDLGLEAGMRAANLASQQREVRLWNTGQSWTLYSQDSPVPWDRTLFMMLRSEPQRLLAEAILRIKPDAIRLNAKAVGFEQDEHGVRVLFQDGSSATGDALIGADGLHSKIRQAAFGVAPGTFTGVVAWRGLVPKDRLPAEYARPAFSTWIGPTAHITIYHVKRGAEEVVSFSAQADSAWQAESWHEVGSIAECLKDFEGWHADIRHLITQAEVLFKWGLFLRAPLPQWSLGRVSLLGDACHPMVPYLGQGANMAIEDGAILARCFALHPADPVRALQRYEQARITRANKVVAASAAMQDTFHNPLLKTLETAEPYIKTQWHPDKVAARNNWLFEYNARTVAI